MSPPVEDGKQVKVHLIRVGLFGGTIVATTKISNGNQLPTLYEFTIGSLKIDAKNFKQGKYYIKIEKVNKIWFNTKLVQSPQFTILTRPASFDDSSVVDVYSTETVSDNAVAMSYFVKPKFQGKVTFTAVNAETGALVS